MKGQIICQLTNNLSFCQFPRPDDMGRAKQYCLFLSVLVIYVCLKKEKNLTLKTCAPDFSTRSMTKLYAKIKGAHAISLFDFPKTWQVCISHTNGHWLA